jgi:hypothetical protein
MLPQKLASYYRRPQNTLTRFFFSSSWFLTILWQASRRTKLRALFKFDQQAPESVTKLKKKFFRRAAGIKRLWAFSAGCFGLWKRISSRLIGWQSWRRSSPEHEPYIPMGLLFSGPPHELKSRESRGLQNLLLSLPNTDTKRQWLVISQERESKAVGT